MGCVFELGVLFGCLTFSTAEVHTLRYFYTATSGISSFPEFISVGMVDGVDISYYDSVLRKGMPKQSWMEINQEYWESETSVGMGQHQIFKADIEILKGRFNHTEGVHVLQKMYGCMWDDETRDTDGYEQFGYDGNDFLSLDLKTKSWFAPVPQAILSKTKWNNDQMYLEKRNYYFGRVCIDWLKKYVQYGSSTLERKVPPEVFLSQKDSSVVCHATGFYPDGVMITWKRDGEEMWDDVDVGETLPNGDGTFQKRVALILSADKMKKGQYTCEVAHKSGKPIIKTLILEDVLVRLGNILGIIIGCVVASLVIIGAIVGAVMMKKKGYRKAEHGIGMVDGVAVCYYDSNTQRMAPMQRWMEDNLDQQYWEEETKLARTAKQALKADIEILKLRFNQTDENVWLPL
ncbi:patr class I histocompatibility antigen, A-5 alpha chain-like [Alosa sapidissima]|uniref:patr class I histocompatibility antigen, A-5 alpha chain-like n=1 Tax=Alosa sapidissima TaxID=34773 RepID=UPI001C092267|nr:patr class I histocompatibility antigen, A-5 alpha chain-like [Alosa sapidissima]